MIKTRKTEVILYDWEMTLSKFKATPICIVGCGKDGKLFIGTALDEIEESNLKIEQEENDYSLTIKITKSK